MSRLEAKRPGVRRRVLERLRQTGGNLRAACASPGMPHETTVRFWRRADPAYDAAVRELMARGRAARRHVFDPAKAREIVRRLDAGEALRSILADPRMPYERGYRHWIRTQPWFAEACGRAIRRRRAEIQRQVHPPLKRFDPAVAEAILLAVAKGTPVKRLSALGFPGKRVIARWRREEPEFDLELWRIAAQGPTVRAVLRARAAAAKVSARVGRGGSLRSVAAERGMPSGGSLRNYLRRHPEFAARVREAADERDDLLADEILSIAEGPGEVAEKRQRMRALYARMRHGRAGEARLPKGPPAWLKDEADEPPPVSS